MRRRPEDGDDARFPPGLLVFDGRELGSYDEWTAGFDAWCTVREAWEAAHPGVRLPEQVLSKCPFEDELPHGGLWSRPQPDDGLGVRCREHDLTAGEH